MDNRGFVQFSKGGRTIWGGRGITPETLKHTRWAWETCDDTRHIEVVVRPAPPKGIYKRVDKRKMKVKGRYVFEEDREVVEEAIATASLPRSITDPMAFGQRYQPVVEPETSVCNVFVERDGKTGESVVSQSATNPDDQELVEEDMDSGERGSWESLLRVAQLEYFQMTFDPVVRWPTFPPIPSQAIRAYPNFFPDEESKDGEKSEPTLTKFVFDCVEIPVKRRSLDAYKRISALAKRTRGKVLWTPVLLGGLYEATKAPQGKAGSATDEMIPQKLAYNQIDLRRTLKRYNLDIKFHPKHPVRTVDALRLLHATPDSYREELTHALYHSYWVDNDDISDRSFLLEKAKSLKIPYTDEYPLDNSLFTNKAIQNRLQDATQQAFERGAPGVPSFWINDYQGGRLFWGQDRLHFVEGVMESLSRGIKLEEIEDILRFYPRLIPRGTKSVHERRLRFWFDFASPWSFLAYTQLERIQSEAGEKVIIEYMPIVLGGLFKSVRSTPFLLNTLSPSKYRYFRQDLSDWTNFWNIVGLQSNSKFKPFELNWPDIFPIRTITASRVFLLEPKTIDCIFRAAWSDNVRIGTSDEILASILTKAGFDGAALVLAANANVDNVKGRLLSNTALAEQKGLFGLPTFQVDEGELVWGQDRINIVEDFLVGWQYQKTSEEYPISKL
ncbi:hypothetical protein G9A89_018964 [Geosiphon pyriformis]|nr:hypothetical protein G9A89_018964 [Geosiphon pyriformis]